MIENPSNNAETVQHPRCLLIAGASARAAAESARRGGFECVAIDLYRDVDLENVCKTCLRVPRLDQIPQIASGLSADVFMYTGCMENRPQIIEQLKKTSRLVGNGVSAIAKVRDPFWLTELAAKYGFHFAESRRTSPEQLNETWLLKPFNSCGGQRIELFDPAKPNALNPAREHEYFFQKHVAGESISAAYLAGARQTKLLGISRQLVGEAFLGAQPFSYCGSLGPYSGQPELEIYLTRIGQTIADEAGLVGLFGLDLILGADGVTLIEVNPRYTASMEIIDYSRRISCVQQHVQACLGQVLPIDGPHQNFVCKLIQYSNTSSLMKVTPEFTAWALATNTPDFIARLADIPSPGTEIRSGSPIFSAIGVGESELVAFNRAKRLCEVGHNLMRKAVESRAD